MMETMKQTGIQWIGEIPSDWNTKKIKYMATLKGRIGWQGLTSDEYQDDGAYLITGVDFSNGGIDWENCVHVPMKRWEEAKDIQIQNGDLLITKDGTIGKVAIVSNMPGETSLNSGVLRIMPIEGYSKRFLYWVIKSAEFWNWFNFKNAGNSTIIHLYQGDFEEFIFAFPNYEEQEIIADYLDKHCGMLDNIISDLQKQVETLKAYKGALITKLVSLGTNEKTFITDSGIRWIGSIPHTWCTKRIKYVCKLVRGGSPRPIDDYLSEDENHINWVRIGDTQKGYKYIDDTELKIIPAGAARSRYVEPGTLLLTNSMSFGQPYIMNIYGCIHDGWLAFSDFHGITKEYLYYVLMSDICLKQFEWAALGAVVENLSIDKVSNVFIPIPPIDEQKKIVAFLDAQLPNIEYLILQQEKQLEAMRKHKEALIFEYVTGKKRVKEVQ
ncbi:restriction endonuclease subunit S [[Clostridium] symbiosum]|uniref:restriction endonuclease subunit S n=1 Tax=Clostridium symbiosum TaxID=1512 RepID=UPI001105A711|nr:restriction endonuclease subunit S [[Clostridium] symbiosum]